VTVSHFDILNEKLKTNRYEHLILVQISFKKKYTNKTNNI